MSKPVTGALKDLAEDPLNFLNKHPVLFEPAANIPAEYRAHAPDASIFRAGNAGIKLVPSPRFPSAYNFTFVPLRNVDADRDAVNAYVVGFNPRQAGHNVPYVDVPVRAYAENTFCFTVGLTGCSVVVTRLPDGKTYRVFHDSRMDSSVLYTDVHLRVDFNDYRIGGKYLSHTGKAIALLLFKGGAWKMYMQRQLPELDAGTPPEVYAVQVQEASAGTEEAFNNRRTILQNRVKANGKNLRVNDSVIGGAVDGVVRGVGYSEDAIRGWNALRAAVKVKVDAYKNDANREPRLRDTYRRYEDDNSQSKDMDVTWIWLRIKKNT